MKNLLCVGLLAFAGSATADVVTLTPIKDNTLYQNAQGALSNGAGNHFFCGRNASNQTRRGLVAFDIAGAIPAGATIDSVELTLNMSRTIGAAADCKLHRVFADWGEGTSVAIGEEGGGAPATNGDATWIHRFRPNDLWEDENGRGLPGGWFSMTISAQTSVDAEGPYQWSGQGLIDDVQFWLDNPGQNFGWILLGDETMELTAKRFDTRENPTIANRPSLRIEFSTAVCYADCDQSTGPGVLDIFDFLCFGNRFSSLDPYACDCDTSTGPGVCDIFDFLCFGNAFNKGCP